MKQKQNNPLKQKQKIPQMMQPIIKNKKVDSNTKIENTSIDLITLN